MKKLLHYIVHTLEKYNVKYEVHSFDSGAIMVDIWINNNFYVIQIDAEIIGLSLITKETTPFDIVPDQTFKDETLFRNAFDIIFHNIEPRKTIVINANNFSTLEGFYSEIVNVLTKDLDWTTGHNLDAFNDLLRGGFGVHEYEEPIKLIWQHSSKSKTDLNALRQNETVYEILKSIIKEHNHIEFIEG